jgi:hypothetical protein
VDYIAYLLNLRTAYKLKLSYFTVGGDQTAASEKQKKKILPTSQTAGETTTELLFKYQHQEGMLEE